MLRIYSKTEMSPRLVIVPLTISYHLEFPRISKVWSVFTSQASGASSKERILFLWAIFCLVYGQFLRTFCFVFLSFSFLLLGYTGTNFKVTDTNISQTLQVNNSIIPMIKNAKYPGYYFDKEHEHLGIFSHLHQCTCNEVSNYHNRNWNW